MCLIVIQHSNIFLLLWTFLFRIGPIAHYWLPRCQYNVTEWCAMLVCDIVHQCASHQCPLVQSRSKTLAQTHAPHELVYRLILEINKNLISSRMAEKLPMRRKAIYTTNQPDSAIGYQASMLGEYVGGLKVFHYVFMFSSSFLILIF